MKMKLEEVVQKLRKQGVLPKAALYARFSSDNQRDESIDAQIRAIRKFAEDNDMLIVREYIDKARSATNDDREQFQKMIEDAGKGEFNFVIVHKLDRFARNRSDSVGYRVKLAQKGVMLTSVLENYDADTPEGALMEGLAELIAEFYSRNLSREVKKGQKENALSAKHNGGTPPFGYNVDRDTKRLVINDIEAEGVRMIFDMVLEYKSYEEILKALNEGGYKTKRGSSFVRNSLHDILRNPKYTGIYFYGRIVNPVLGKNGVNSHAYNSLEDMITVEDGVPAIITKEEFEKVQAILDKRKQTRNGHNQERYLLAGKAVCGCCGFAYCGNRSFNKKNNYAHITYRCSGRRKHLTEKCTNGEVNRDLLEAKVLEIISNIVFDPGIIPKLVAKYESYVKTKLKEKAGRLKMLQKQVKETDSKINNIMKVIEDGSSSKVLINRLETLEQEKQALMVKLTEEESKIKKEGADPDKLKLLFNKAKEMFETGELEQTKQLIEMFVEKVIINEDKIIVKLNSAPFLLDTDVSAIEVEIARSEIRLYNKRK